MRSSNDLGGSMFVAVKRISFAHITKTGGRALTDARVLTLSPKHQNNGAVS
jgi:hypothetical protein